LSSDLHSTSRRGRRPAAHFTIVRVRGAPYAALRSRALELEVFVASRDDLIAMKYARGRSIDRSDIIALTEP
jgi:hypothetical protein